MKKNNFTTIKLAKGEMNIYDFGELKLHLYKTNDAFTDVVLLLQKKNNLIAIEQPNFVDNIKELTQYIKDIGGIFKGKILAYHNSGTSFFPADPVYSTKNAEDYAVNGGGKILVDNFVKNFGSQFDGSLCKITNYIDSDHIIIDGIEMKIIKTPEAFDIEFPEINSIYIHILGHDCHSIIPNEAGLNAIIIQLKKLIQANYDLIFTSHYPAENIEDVKTKIAYLEYAREAAVQSKSAEEFRSKMKKKYSEYSGDYYLNMTSEFLFPVK
ncbi:MAG: hypothetical protein LBD07_02760 [Spirochaetaceae bacterium]|jgi:hypothetical protein|nr:hypothetical protein [Spirochaetaceae bacterium]